MLVLAPPDGLVHAHKPESHHPSAQDAADREGQHGRKPSDVPWGIGLGPQVCGIDVGGICEGVHNRIADGLLLGRLR